MKTQEMRQRLLEIIPEEVLYSGKEIKVFLNGRFTTNPDAKGAFCRISMHGVPSVKEEVFSVNAVKKLLQICAELDEKCLETGQVFGSDFDIHFGDEVGEGQDLAKVEDAAKESVEQEHVPQQQNDEQTEFAQVKRRGRKPGTLDPLAGYSREERRLIKNGEREKADESRKSREAEKENSLGIPKNIKGKRFVIAQYTAEEKNLLAGGTPTEIVQHMRLERRLKDYGVTEEEAKGYGFVFRNGKFGLEDENLSGKEVSSSIEELAAKAEKAMEEEVSSSVEEPDVKAEEFVEEEEIFMFPKIEIASDPVEVDYEACKIIPFGKILDYGGFDTRVYHLHGAGEAKYATAVSQPEWVKGIVVAVNSQKKAPKGKRVLCVAPNFEETIFKTTRIFTLDSLEGDDGFVNTRKLLLDGGFPDKKINPYAGADFCHSYPGLEGKGFLPTKHELGWAIPNLKVLRMINKALIDACLNPIPEPDEVSNSKSKNKVRFMSSTYQKDLGVFVKNFPNGTWLQYNDRAIALCFYWAE